MAEKSQYEKKQIVYFEICEVFLLLTLSTSWALAAFDTAAAARLREAANAAYLLVKTVTMEMIP